MAAYTLYTIIALILVPPLILARNSLIYSIRRRRLDEMRDFLDHPSIGAYLQAGWTNSKDDYHAIGSYEANLFLHLHKWTYRQFFPRSVEECAQAVVEEA